jgi:hypothetical protein
MTHPSHRSFLSGDGLFLSLNAGLFVMFSFPQFGEYTRLFAQFFETANGTFDGLVFSDSNSSHTHITPNPAGPFFWVLNFSSFKCQVKYFTAKIRSWKEKDVDASPLEIIAAAKWHGYKSLIVRALKDEATRALCPHGAWSYPVSWFRSSAKVTCTVQAETI